MRDNKIVNLVADVIAPLAVVTVTAALFFIFMPENPGTLFWTNLVYSVFLEVILFAYIFWLPIHKYSLVLKWLCGVYSIYYVGTALIWMLVFSLSLSRWCPIKVYFSVIAVLTVLWILVGALSFKVDKANEKSSTVLSENRHRVNLVSSNAEMLLQQFNLIKSAHEEFISASSSVTSLCRTLATLSPTVVADYHTFKRVNTICSGLEDILSEPISDESPSRLKEFADQSLITLNFIKKTSLK